MSPKPVVKVGHLYITDHLVLGVTQDKLKSGKETFQNLDLELKAYRGWNPLQDDLRSGALDAACILAPIAMEQFYAGVKIKLILQTHKSGSVIIKNKRANINTITDFKGKSVLIPHYLSVHHLLFDKLLRESGLEIGVGKDINFDVVAPSDIPEIMEWDEKGSVGGFIVAEPFGAQVVKAGYGEVFALSKDIWPNHPCCVLVVKDELVGKYPDAVQELSNSLVASGKFIHENSDAAAQIGAKFLNQDVDVIKRVLTEPKGRVTFDELFPVIADFETIQKYLTEKIHAMSDKINLEKLVDTRFATEAKAK